MSPEILALRLQLHVVKEEVTDSAWGLSLLCNKKLKKMEDLRPSNSYSSGIGGSSSEEPLFSNILSTLDNKIPILPIL